MVKLPASVAEPTEDTVLVSFLIHGELITVSLERERVFVVVCTVALTKGLLVLEFEPSIPGVAGYGLSSSSLRIGYKVSVMMQAGGFEQSIAES